tara:strand:+ start:257 stop:586 length:330 start_codon:yes stop_codon:yes gene_type:complete
MRDDMLHVSWSPTNEDNEANEARYLLARYPDELYNDKLPQKIEDLVESALWDEQTKHEFHCALPVDMSNGEMLDVIEYLWDYQPKTPFSEIKNPTQKQIGTFIRKVCNL